MKTNITKDRFGNEQHTGPLFPAAEDRQFSYQGESVSFSMNIEAHPPHRRDGTLNRDLPDSPYSHFELCIERHTGKGLTFELRAFRKDIVEQRIANGFAVTEDVLISGMQFGELCNRLFSD